MPAGKVHGPSTNLLAEQVRAFAPRLSGPQVAPQRSEALQAPPAA